jgi:intein/homing endonuclease
MQLKELVLRVVKINAEEKGDPLNICIWGEPGIGKCVDGNTIVWYNGSIGRIKDLYPNAIDSTEKKKKVEVISFDNQNNNLSPAITSSVWKDPCKKGYELITDMGYSISTSPWHPIWCYKDGNIGYHKSSDIEKAKDVWVPIVVNEPYTENRVSSKYKSISITYRNDNRKRVNSKLINKEVIINEDIAYLLGVLIGDGSLGSLGKHDSIVMFDSIDYEIVDEISRIVKKNFSGTVNKDDLVDSKCAIRTKYLSSIVHKLGCNKLSQDKFIPSIILESPKSVLISFIQGLFDTDGSALKTGYVEYSSCSKQLAHETQQVLLRFGILSDLRFKSNKCKGAWVVTIMGDARKYYDRIGFRLSRKQNRKDNLPLTNNDNRSYYPSIIGKIMHDAFLTRANRGVVDTFVTKHRKTPGRAAYTRWRPWFNGKHSPSRNLMDQFVIEMNAFDVPDIKKYYMDGNIVWLKLRSINKTDVDLYDLCVPGNHSFVANGFINHNTYSIYQLENMMIDVNGKQIPIQMREVRPAEATEQGDIVGYPKDNGTSATMLRYDFIPAEDEDGPGIILWDDANRGNSQVLNSIMGIMQTGRSAYWKMGKGWTHIMTANPDNGLNDVTGFDAAKLTRTMHVRMTFSVDDWVQWATEHGIYSPIVAFAKHNPESFYNPDPAKAYTKTCPRSWVTIGRVLKAIDSEEQGLTGSHDKDQDFRRIIHAGINDVPATTFMSFLRENSKYLVSPGSFFSDYKNTMKVLDDAHKNGRDMLIYVTFFRLSYYMTSSGFVATQTDKEARIAKQLIVDSENIGVRKDQLRAMLDVLATGNPLMAISLGSDKDVLERTRKGSSA